MYTWCMNYNEFKTHAYYAAQKWEPFADKASERTGVEGCDVIHDAYIKAVEYYGRYPEKFNDGRAQNLSMLLFVIVRNTIASLVKHKKVERKYDHSVQHDILMPLEDIPSAEDDMLFLELSPEMERALEGINSDQADTLWLHYVADMKAQDIADVLRVPLGTVLTRLHRGRKMLKKAYKEENQKGVN